MSELINGRTPEEIKTGLSCSGSRGNVKCSECAYCMGQFGDEDCNYECDQIDNDALALIQHLEAKRTKWISVKERLPDVQETVLFCHMLNKDVRSVRTGYRSAFTPERFYTISGMGTDTVTHWMPLPTPPKEDAHE